LKGVVTVTDPKPGTSTFFTARVVGTGGTVVGGALVGGGVVFLALGSVVVAGTKCSSSR
jgi:hypothetical protein